MEDFGERTTGTKDEHYNLISVLYHALHGADNCDHYAMDAEAGGDERLGAFFREAQAAQVQIAQRGKELLGLVESPPEFGTPPPASTPPDTTTTAGGVPRRGRETDVPPTTDVPRSSSPASPPPSSF
jgi:hypothetical protein